MGYVGCVGQILTDAWVAWVKIFFTWVNILRGLRGLNVFLRGSKFFLRRSKFSAWVKVFACVNFSVVGLKKCRLAL